MTPTFLYWPAAASGASWSPSSLTSLAAWYDASDATTITTSGSLVSNWNDKSGNAYHLAQSTSANRPTYTTSGLGGLNVVTFNSTHWLSASNASDWTFLHDATGSSVFLVVQYTRADRMAFLWTSPFNSQKFGWTLCSNLTSQNLYNLIPDSSNSWSVLNQSSSSTLPINTAHVVGVVCDPSNATASARSSMRINGDAAIQLNTRTGTPPTSAPNSPLTLGRDGDSSMVGLEGFIAEVVVCNAQVSATDREKTEGYLAHKWGLASSLPAGHPYKSSAP